MRFDRSSILVYIISILILQGLSFKDVLAGNLETKEASKEGESTACRVGTSSVVDTLSKDVDRISAASSPSVDCNEPKCIDSNFYSDLITFTKAIRNSDWECNLSEIYERYLSFFGEDK